jgi:hypothetical protein
MPPGTMPAVLIAIIEKPPSSNRLSLSFTSIFILSGQRMGQRCPTLVAPWIGNADAIIGK